MLLASLTLLFAPAVPGLVQTAEPPAGLPFPTLRPTTYDLQELASGEMEMEPERLWHAARPHQALAGQEDWDFAQARADRAEALAEINGWSRSEKEAWLVATAPKPIVLRYRVTQGDQVITSGEQPILPGTPVTLGHAVHRRVVADFNVEIAQNSSVVDPDVRLAFTGAQIGLVAVPVAGRGWWLETCMVFAQPGKPALIDLGNPGMVGKSRDERTMQEFSGPILLNPQQERVIELANGMRVQLQIDAAPGPGQQAAGRAIRVDVPTVNLDAGLQGILDDFDSSIVWAHPSGMLLLDADTGARAAGEILRAAAEATLVDLRATVREGEAAGLLQLRGIAGRDYHFAAGRAMDVLADWDVEVASRSRMADPQFDRVFLGWSGKIGAEAIAGALAESRCDVARSGRLSQQLTGLVLSPEQPGADGQDGLPAVLGMLDQMSSWSVRFQFAGPLEDFKASRSMPSEADAAGGIELSLRASVVRE